MCALVPALRHAGELFIDHGRTRARPAIAEALASLEPADRALATFATDLTLWPGRTTSADHAPLRDAGFDAAAIHDIVQVVCLFSWMNRLADGLGVRVEARRHDWARALLGDEALADQLDGLVDIQSH